MAFFCKSVASTERRGALAELAQYLAEWKEPRLGPLLDRQRELFDVAAAREADVADGALPPASGEMSALAAAAAEAARAGHADAVKAEAVASAREELAAVSMKLAELDFSMDSFWVELEQLHLRQGRSRGKAAGQDDVFSTARTCWQDLLAGGQPFQLLHSRPLQIAGRFLRGVLEAIGAPHVDPRGIYVVSVIGAQSSAKSTLLNFLFGCGFAVSAGRCTRGLFASYLRPVSGGPSMLVLDSEGLLSLGSEGSVFDGQIALMCMTCSHLVLVNHKGELSRQLQDLLEICLFAMRHLRLARLQPRLAFVLRDQHDRSRVVHEDMLKQMKGHLEDVARTLGSPLQDLILLDSTAVFLLPSAVTSELRQGQEVCWTSELFAREVLHLRGEVFRWLREDTERRASWGPAEFSSLATWYDYAATVWETLDQFGEQLLHYRTIHEIELRRELADVAKNAVRDALDGTGGDSEADGATTGFHARARMMVDSFVARMHANPTRLDLETTDLELSRALACLRDEFVARLEQDFQARASSPRFSATAKEQAKQQIRTPVEWAFENHLYTWKLHLKKASDERAMHELWVHFTGVLNRHLARSGHRSCLSEDESKALFEREWGSYEVSYRDRLCKVIKEWQTLAHEVTLLFNHAVGKLQHEAGSLALLKEVGPQQVALHRGKGREQAPASLLDQTDEEWAEHYFYLGWWNTVKNVGLALLQNAGGSEGGGAAGVLRTNIVPRIRQAVQQGLQQVRSEVISRGALDEATAAEFLRHISCGLLHDVETRLITDGTVSVKRPQMLHALHVALRVACVEALVAVEEEKQQKAMEDLFAQKAHIEEHFLLIVQANKGDIDFAKNIAKLYHRSLTGWLDCEVTQLAANVRSQVLQEMPDPQKSAERAFQQSFAAHSWQDVLEYVLDMNAYLEKLYLTIFHQRKRSYIGAAQSRVEKRVLGTYHLLVEVIGQWARKETAVSPDVANGPALHADVTKGPSSPRAQKSVRDLKDFISTHAERVPRNADTAEAHRQLAERFPASAEFTITDPKLFAETLQAVMSDYADSPDIRKRLAEKLDKALREQSVQAWSLIRGCSEHCPMCGSKCDLVGEHSHHHCSHHLFPAFHGWMDRNTGLPSFNFCLADETRAGTYECKDGVWRTLEDYLKSDHPSWLPFARDDDASAERDVQHLRAAWVNCREPLLEYFSPMADGCPECWVKDYHEEGRSLTRADLQTAKETIRRLRNHTWAPPSD
uniref:VLIG-type G domain-containing protein n=1 Tax=Zooxanthella nutricula TaxID=1333877 RepID=A0A6U6K0G9_9DINO